jgi:hypothetical protein
MRNLGPTLTWFYTRSAMSASYVGAIATVASGTGDVAHFCSIFDHSITFSSSLSSMSDPRFARLTTDPRFRKIKKNDHKVVVDDRFRSIFQDDKKSNKQKSKGPILFGPFTSWLRRP